MHYKKVPKAKSQYKKKKKRLKADSIIANGNNIIIILSLKTLYSRSGMHTQRHTHTKKLCTALNNSW